MDYNFKRDATEGTDVSIADDQKEHGLLPVDLYHVKVVDIDEPDEEHAYLGVKLEIVKGVNSGEDYAGRLIFQNFYLPSENHKDGGVFCEKLIAGFMIACGLMTEEEFKEGKGADPDDCLEKEILVRVKHDSYTPSDGGDKRVNARIDGLHMYDRRDERVPEMIEKFKAKAAKNAKKESRNKKFKNI